MAKPATLQIKLLSTADTGYFYVTKKNPRTKPEKLELKKYDPKARKHVIFRESKIKQGFVRVEKLAMTVSTHLTTVLHAPSQERVTVIQFVKTNRNASA